MKGRLKFLLQFRGALALGLFFVLALVLAFPTSHNPDGASQRDRFQPVGLIGRRAATERGPRPRDLPNDCGIVATEAAARLASTGAWTRLIFVHFRYPHDERVCGHILAVWQPPTAHVVCIYDVNGTWDLATDKHESAQIGKEWAHIARVAFIKAHFIR